LADFVKRSFFKGVPVQVIHNGIDLQRFKPTEGNFREAHGLQGKQIILGVASVWTDRKGLSDFVKLQTLLREDQQIVLVGLNDAQLAALPAGIIGIKRTNSVEELAEIYTAADVFFNPTYEDNYPTTNLEAISCGTPVVTYRTGGSPESVVEGNGFAEEQGDLEVALAAFDRVNGCAVDMDDAFDAAQRYKEYTALYNELSRG
jgi:glycosyltransferase involved in cell wall biosynthesis